MKKRHVYLFLCFLWMAVIFWFSSQVGSNSQGMSNQVIFLFEKYLHIDLMVQGEWLFNTVSFLVRKIAHMSEYAILAILFATYLKACEIEKYWQFALLGVLLYACSDEFHQLFVEGRSGQLKDIWIDTIGGICGVVLQQRYIKFKNHKEY